MRRGGEAVNNVQCRTLIAKVLACILSNIDLIGGRIGLPTEAGLKPSATTNFKQIVLWGVYFAEVLCESDEVSKARQRFSQRADQRMCRPRRRNSAPVYKQFTPRFFNDLKVVRYVNISDLILVTRNAGQ